MPTLGNRYGARIRGQIRHYLGIAGTALIAHDQTAAPAVDQALTGFDALWDSADLFLGAGMALYAVGASWFSPDKRAGNGDIGG